MTSEQENVLEHMQDMESIIAFNYWENFKHHKEMAQSLGGQNKRVKQIGEESEKLRLHWTAYQKSIEEFIKSTE